MALPAELAARSALSRVCTRCSISLRRQGRVPNRLLQVSQSQQQRRSVSGKSSGITSRQYALPAQTPASKRFLSAFAQTGFSSTSPSSDSQPKRVLAADDLFHSFTNSPIPEIRRRAAFIRQHAGCPHHHHQPGGGMAPAHVNFECPDCGIPVYCSEEHWADDYEAHLQICDTLRQINEDDHDLRSGRFFPEFEYAGPQMEEALINMTNWDTFLYTRNFNAINDDRSMRQATRLLTYPITIGSIIHELSPYNLKAGGRLTPEGIKSFSGMSPDIGVLDSSLTPGL
jgi:splicing suppressor protein 51